MLQDSCSPLILASRYSFCQRSICEFLGRNPAAFLSWRSDLPFAKGVGAHGRVHPTCRTALVVKSKAAADPPVLSIQSMVRCRWASCEACMNVAPFM